MVSGFTVANYVLLARCARPGDVDLSKPGFRVRPVQARVGANLVNSPAHWTRNYRHTDDPDTQQPFENKAVIGPNADGSYDEAVVIDYSTVGTDFPGIPGTEGNTDFCAEDVITYLQLAQGYYVFGVNSDDGFRVTTGADPRDAFATVSFDRIGTFRGGGHHFSFVAGQAGIYPFRLVWENGQEWHFMILFGQSNGRPKSSSMTPLTLKRLKHSEYGVATALPATY